MVNYNRWRTSWVSEENILYPPLQEWAVYKPKMAKVISDVTIYDNLLCVSMDGTPNTVEAIDMESGDSLWTFQLPGTGGSMSFACAQNDSFVFVGGQHGKGLYALKRQSGKVVWHNELGTLY
jgi:outer membrane protein assembly factor BamB